MICQGCGVGDAVSAIGATGYCARCLDRIDQVLVAILTDLPVLTLDPTMPLAEEWARHLAASEKQGT